jgi:hypothetical protein
VGSCGIQLTFHNIVMKNRMASSPGGKGLLSLGNGKRGTFSYLGVMIYPYLQYLIKILKGRSAIDYGVLKKIDCSRQDTSEPTYFASRAFLIARIG